MNNGEEFIEKDVFEKTYLLETDKDKYIRTSDTNYTTYGSVYNILVGKAKSLQITEIKTY